MRFSNGRGAHNFGNAATATGVLPTGAADFFRRRLTEAAGVGLFALGAGLLVSILSYTPGDPSLNSVGNGVVGNLLG
ncbi:MAG TPA: DNA translocase FtsK 4TM domain-containing protein, partial [Rhodospirillales bacterium]|nr:DNA translocase FtsK 4TM domain-containing protein [Rhodospirillales bacterium]